MAGEIGGLYTSSGQHMLHTGIPRRPDHVTAIDPRCRPLGGIANHTELGGIPGVRPSLTDMYDPAKYGQTAHHMTAAPSFSHAAAPHTYQPAPGAALKVDSRPLDTLAAYAGNASAVHNGYGPGFIDTQVSGHPAPNVHLHGGKPTAYPDWNDPVRCQTLSSYPGSGIPPPAHGHTRFPHAGHVPWDGGTAVGGGQHFSTGYGVQGYVSQNSAFAYMRPSRAQAGLVDMPNVKIDEVITTPTLQEMDAERTIRRARRNRTCFSRQQMERLEEVFSEHRYPDVYRREEIAHELDLKEEVVRVWFKNRRAKVKRDAKDGRAVSSQSSFGSGQSSTESSASMSPPHRQQSNFPVTMYPPSLANNVTFRPMLIKSDNPCPPSRALYPTAYGLSNMPHNARPIQQSPDIKVETHKLNAATNGQEMKVEKGGYSEGFDPLSDDDDSDISLDEMEKLDAEEHVDALPGAAVACEQNE